MPKQITTEDALVVLSEAVNNLRLTFTVTGNIANVVFTRNDGQELSFSSEHRSLIQFNGREAVLDYGQYQSAGSLIEAILVFAAKIEDEGDELNTTTK